MMRRRRSKRKGEEKGKEKEKREEGCVILQDSFPMRAFLDQLSKENFAHIPIAPFK